jgi:hypothetical protein
MRLLRRKSGGSLELITIDSDHPPPYAILSHTWTNGEEITYQDLVAGTGQDRAGYAKILFCVDKAAEDGLQYSWVDTCCINKLTSDELSTAINSMFRWYRHATKCYVYLSDVHVPEELPDVHTSQNTWIEAFRRSRWFTRGWTLQELIAPAVVEFFTQEGRRLGSKTSLEQEIHEITKIPKQALRKYRRSDFSIKERMAWAEKRETTLKEDRMYCLLGIFGVFIPLMYGEGEEYAFSRLEEEIQKRSGLKGSRDREILEDMPGKSFTRIKQLVFPGSCLTI